MMTVCVLKGSSVEQEGEQPAAVEEGKEKEKADNQPEPLWQLITAFSRSATTEATAVLEADYLYIDYATIMGQVAILVTYILRGGGGAMTPLFSSWNSLNCDTVNSSSLSIFKSKLKTHYFRQTFRLCNRNAQL